MQVLAGRWIHVLQFRRPGIGFLENLGLHQPKEGHAQLWL